jgi:hypothetical protein
MMVCGGVVAGTPRFHGKRLRRFSARHLFVVLSASTLCACAPTVAPAPPAPHIERATFCSTSVDGARSRLAKACGQYGMKVYESAPDMLICGRPQPDLAGPLAQLLLQHTYSTVPTTKVRFVLAPEQQGIEVSGEQWVEAQRATGKIDREPLDSPKHQEGLRLFLAAVAGESCGTGPGVKALSEAARPPAAVAPQPPQTETAAVRKPAVTLSPAPRPTPSAPAATRVRAEPPPAPAPQRQEPAPAATQARTEPTPAPVATTPKPSPAEQVRAEPEPTAPSAATQPPPTPADVAARPPATPTELAAEPAAPTNGRPPQTDSPEPSVTESPAPADNRPPPTD